MNHQEIKLVEDEQHVSWVTLNRPDKHNALSVQMMEELITAFEWIDNANHIRAAVLSGTGKSFCAGADLNWMQANLDKNRDERISESMRLSRLLNSIDQCSKLVIGAINGSSFAGGVGLMSACDIVIGVESASFALTETRLGLVPANIAPFVKRRIGSANIRRIGLNSCHFNANKAVQLGLLDELVSIENLQDAVKKELTQALDCAPQAISKAKKMLAALDNNIIDNKEEYLIGQLADAWENDEAQQGIRAFFAKKSPPWKNNM